MKKGFTLLELLVVIAIIGIIATISLASLSGARNSGDDATRISNLINARSGAQLYYENNSQTFEGVCNKDEGSGIPDNPNNIGEMLTNGAVCVDDNDEWAAYVQLLEPESGDGYCVDSSGFGGEVADPGLDEDAIPAVMSCN